ncbi:ImmA/IrrE family metallo-endopeptidase [Leucothrix pacifica]|uniref:Peptidase n=1 Tax=Leucothrix pacifica TaxID=1247513 RepID=A0A317C2W5_9GAMM|nr:ImmA/IrrE family metallo-endopeptidase [Leucothrix pacifica]PWQ93026.1 peptidase [Leucothrix pacifica]
MATAYANVNHDILNWARQRAQLSAAVLAKKLQVTEAKIRDWESGDLSPTFNQAKKFAKQTRIPFGYLFLAAPPREQSLPLPDLRTVDNEHRGQASAELRDIINIAQQRQEWFLEYAKDNGFDELPFAGKYTIQSSVEEIVGDMRSVLGLPAHPSRGSWQDYFRDLVNGLEAVGILVMRQSNLGHHTRTFSVSEFRGFVLFDTTAPVIFINQADAPSARLFTLIHEASHIWIGESGISDASPATQYKQEVLCNAVAAEFLVPQEEFEEYWVEHEDWQQNIPTLKSHFHVSRWVIARRAQSLGKISLNQYRRYIAVLKAEYQQRETGGSDGPSYYRYKPGQISKRFARSIISEAMSGRVLYRDAGRLLGVKPGNITKLAKELGL